MKNKIVLLMAAALLAACGASTPTDDLGKKKAQRDSLKVEYDELGKQIKEIEDWLAENDSTVTRNLPSVKTMDLQLSTYKHYVDVHGSVRADKAATLTSMMGGRVRRINVTVGQHVGQGTELVTMDNNMAKEQLEQTEAAADLAKIAFEKQERLWQQKIGSEMQFLQAKSQKEQAEAAVGTMKEQWRLSNITAPFAGIVDEVMVREGDMTAPGLPAIRIVDLSGAQLEADVPEGYLSHIEKGAPATVIFPSIHDTVYAQLDHVGGYIDPANRTFKVTVRMPKGDANVQPNLLSDISIQDGKADSALVVPNSAVLDDVKGNSYIFTLEKTKDDEAKAHKVMVKRLSEYKGNIHVQSVEAGQLKGGETIVTQGARNVSDGQSVRIAKQ